MFTCITCVSGVLGDRCFLPSTINPNLLAHGEVLLLVLLLVLPLVLVLEVVNPLNSSFPGTEDCLTTFG